MKKKLFIAAILLISGLLLYSCSNDDDDNIPTTPKVNSALVPSINKKTGMARFSEILSKAAYEKKEVRDFLKLEALQKFDNGYNIFYSLVKDKMVDKNHSFKQILESYANEKEELSDIEKAVPLLNIHFPDIVDLNVANIDTNDEEVPVLYSNKFYLNGEVVDTLSADAIPAFAVFVVDESCSVRKKQGVSTKSSDSGLSINNEYEFVDPAFSPRLANEIRTKASGYETLSEKYRETGLVPKEDIDPELLKAFQNSKDNLRATRSMIYYGMASPNQTPNTIRSDVKDCIFRFKMAGDAFERLESIATDKGKNPLFNGSTSNKKSRLSREEVLKRLLTGRAFCFMFRIEGIINGQTVASEGMKICDPRKIV